MDESEIDILGDNHIATSVDTPMREDAFVHTDDEKIKNIQFHFSKIMEELGLDLTDESLSGTPYRFAKMYVKELFYGLNPKNRPKISTFPNTYGYQRMLVEKDINIDSSCEHHFLPITGYAHVGYIPKDKESATTTFDYGGVFADEAKRAEFFNLLKKDHSSNR